MTGRRGFGLLAVVIAALLLAIAAPPLVRLFTGSYRTVATSEAAMLAAVTASDLLERVADSRFALNHVGDPVEVPGTSGLALMEPFASRYRAKAVISIVRAAGHTNVATGRDETGLLEVTVHLSWEETGKSHSLDTSTLVGDLESLRPSL